MRDSAEAHRRRTEVSAREPGLLEAIAADGRPRLQFAAFALLFSGCFALFLSIRREFLPHDIAFLPDGRFPVEAILRRFGASAPQLEAPLRDFVLDKLRGYPGSREAGAL